MKTRSHVPAFVLAGWAACVTASQLQGQPGGGIDLPTPDLQVFVGTGGAVLIQNVGDGTATVPAFKLQLTCKNAKASTPTLTKVDEPPPALPACGTPFTAGSWVKTVVNWTPGKSAPIDPCGQGSEFKGLHGNGWFVQCLPVAKWPAGDYTMTAKVNGDKAFFEESMENNTSTATVDVKAKRPVGLRTAPKVGITPRTEKPSRSEKP
jgi:hypothetical protein